MGTIKCIIGKPVKLRKEVKEDNKDMKEDIKVIATKEEKMKEDDKEMVWKAKEFHEADAFMDSGASYSFIDSKYAEFLKLPIIGHRRLKMNTFPNEMKEEKCAVVLVSWYKIGIRPIMCMDGLASEQLIPHLSESEREELEVKDIKLQRDPRKIHFVKTELLIGQDMLGEIEDHTRKTEKMKDGLSIYHTVYGSYYAGKRKNMDFVKEQCSKKEAATLL